MAESWGHQHLPLIGGEEWSPMRNTSMQANLKPMSIQLEAIVTRADGTVEDLGCVSYYHQNRWKQLFWDIRNKHKAGRA